MQRLFQQAASIAKSLPSIIALSQGQHNQPNKLSILVLFLLSPIRGEYYRIMEINAFSALLIDKCI
jgi:hypothetical protein